MRHLRIPALTVLLGLLGACGGEAAHDAKMEVRVYAVPAEATATLVQTLNKVFDAGDKPALGKVTSPAPGQLVVLAPASLQGSVEKSLRELAGATAATPASAAPEPTMRLSFWCVDAVPEAGADDASLETLLPALEEVRRQLGAVHFELRDLVSAVSSPGETVERSWVGTSIAGVTPPQKQLAYTLRRHADDYALDIRIGDQVGLAHSVNGTTTVQYLASGANTTTSVRPGQTLVLAQSPIPDNDASATPASLMRLYLVRVDAVAQ